MRLSEKEYTGFYLSQATRLPMAAFFLPLFIGGYINHQGIVGFEKLLSLIAIFGISAFITFCLEPCKSLFKGYRNYRYQALFVFIFLLVIPVSLFDYFNSDPLLELIGWLLYAVGIVVNMLLHFYWLKGQNFDAIGWHTKEVYPENEEPEGSPVGNKIAVFLGGLLFLGLASLLVAAFK